MVSSQAHATFKLEGNSDNSPVTPLQYPIVQKYEEMKIKEEEPDIVAF